MLIGNNHRSIIRDISFKYAFGICRSRLEFFLEDMIADAFDEVMKKDVPKSNKLQVL